MVLSHPCIAEGMDIPAGKATQSNKTYVSMTAKQRMFNSRALKEVTNKLDPKPMKLKLVWAGLKGANEPSSREVGPASKWETWKSNDGMGEVGLRENVELKTRGGPSTSRPPDPTKIPKSLDALPTTQKSQNNGKGSRGRGRQKAASDAKAGQLALQNYAEKEANASEAGNQAN